MTNEDKYIHTRIKQMIAKGEHIGMDEIFALIEETLHVFTPHILRRARMKKVAWEMFLLLSGMFSGYAWRVLG